MQTNKELFGLFKAESDERLNKLDKGLVELEKQPGNVEIVKELNREAHTLKGAARVFGFIDIQNIAHKVEDVFDRVAQQKLVFSSAIADAVFKALDAIRMLLDKAAKEEDTSGVDLSPVFRQLEACLGEKAAEPAAEPQQKAEAPQIAAEKSGQDITPKYWGESSPKKRDVFVDEYIRVSISRINKLLNLIGEVVINKVKSSHKIAQAKRMIVTVRDVQKRFSLLSEKIKQDGPGDKAEIAKLVNQCQVDLQKLMESSAGLYDLVSTETFHLDPVIDELQANMKELRMVPLATILSGFPRMIRDIAVQNKKSVNIEIIGEKTELDKKVLEAIKTPLMHILRNCVDHGIESPQDRVKAGKPADGTIRLSAGYKAGNVVITVEDDGAGIDPDQVKAVALRKKIVTQKELELMTPKEIQGIVFMNGFSTSPIITDVSGRGIGLDVVRREIENLEGQILLDSEKGKGTKFSLLLPLTIAIIKVIIVRISGMLFALPLASITESLKVKLSDISSIEGRMAIQVRDHTIPVVRLRDILELPVREETEQEGAEAGKSETVEIIIAQYLEKSVGFIVDDVIGDDEIFIKGLGQHLGKVKNVSGATILGSGEVVVILDVPDLIGHSALSFLSHTGRKHAGMQEKKEKHILVVEDALSTRELEKSILEAHGYLVDTAIDGLDGIEKVSRTRYDVIVTDINMPRMDGFEFCTNLKKSAEYKEIPVVIVTTLEKEEDRRRGIEVGASAYIIKSSFDQMNLLDTIERLVG